jgi:uncharacterized membrane protein
MAPFEQQQKESNTEITRFRAQAFAGPLPPPEVLAKYNEAVPDAAERILAMAEKQNAHRQALESKIVQANISSQTRGSYFGFIVAMTAILGGIYLVIEGKDGQGLAAIITSLAALTTVFIIGKRQEQKELRSKSDAIAKRVKPPE